MNSTTEIEGLVACLKGKSGYLPCQFIEKALKEGMIHSQVPIEASQIQPVSLDLRLGQKAYRIQCSFLPENDPVETRLKDVTLYEFDLSKGGILEKNAIYLIPLAEELNLPPEWQQYEAEDLMKQAHRRDGIDKITDDGSIHFNAESIAILKSEVGINLPEIVRHDELEMVAREQIRVAQNAIKGLSA